MASEKKLEHKEKFYGTRGLFIPKTYNAKRICENM